MAKNRASDSEMADESSVASSHEGSPEQEDVPMDVCSPPSFRDKLLGPVNDAR